VLTLDELSMAVGLSPARLARLVRLGLIESNGPDRHTFTAATAAKLRRMLRLRRDLGVNLHGAAVIVDLVERLATLERELARRGPDRTSTPNLEVTEIWIRTD
jgi:chaperone modulatory protein CbpM